MSVPEDQLEFHLPAPPALGETPLIPARMVNEFVYCPRLAYLMWTQGEWADTGDTVEGNRVHARVDRPSAPLPAPEALANEAAAAADKIVSRSLTLSSPSLGVIAKLDIAEAEDGFGTPVDYKRGRRPHIAQSVTITSTDPPLEGMQVPRGAARYCHRSPRFRARRYPSRGPRKLHAQAANPSRKAG